MAGEEMEADAANDGWYYIWLPAWANHVIINANEGNVQTEEQILDTNAAWITVSAADTVEISYESKTTGEAPAYVEKFVVHAKVDDSWVPLPVGVVGTGWHNALQHGPGKR